MGTRSMIARAEADGSFRAIYCHWDGYPAHNGRLLLNHYSDPDRVGALLELGNLSSLAEEIGEQHPFDRPDGLDREAYDARWGKMTTAFGRDRGEKDQQAQSLPSFRDLSRMARGCCAEWLYVWLDERWLFAPVPSTGRGPTLSRMALLTEETIR